MNFLNKLERKFGRHAITGLMKYIIICYIIGYIIEFVAPRFMSFLTLEPYMIFHYAGMASGLLDSDTATDQYFLCHHYDDLLLSTGNGIGTDLGIFPV